ncbi:uncharacterized protein LOC111628467 [Centruroides sculpturatus]|uniref:uncharacterized protein LOC111628467 n=1 Tax=Centruroides sculpturatus TaxID=218467 RepID=UPI000C6D723E|nr:uncharacterized protein LOC111628467 [Centruroides sculpturatus]
MNNFIKSEEKNTNNIKENYEDYFLIPISRILHPTERIAELACPKFPYFVLYGSDQLDFIKRAKNVLYIEPTVLEKCLEYPIQQSFITEGSTTTSVKHISKIPTTQIKPKLIVFPVPKRVVSKSICSERLSQLAKPRTNWSYKLKEEMNQSKRKITQRINKIPKNLSEKEKIKKLFNPSPVCEFPKVENDTNKGTVQREIVFKYYEKDKMKIKENSYLHKVESNKLNSLPPLKRENKVFKHKKHHLKKSQN